LFQTPFGITACERARIIVIVAGATCFKRLSASLHVKAHTTKKICSTGTCFKRLSASLHVKDCAAGKVCILPSPSFKRLSASLHVKGKRRSKMNSSTMFQTPFGITACERRSRHKSWSGAARCFKRLSASLHVKVCANVAARMSPSSFQTPFGITACER